MNHVIIGTAGHIDHGKTSVVKALTGVDTDRLKEEKERGLTIDLGFAHMGEKATIIDVPGHERFVRNMVAGVSTIDFVLFIIAADDGVMPQTREHLDILKILQIKHGIIVITKIDLIENDWLSLVKDDIQNLVKNTFLEKSALVEVSSITGQGVPELQALLDTELQNIQQKQNKGIFWMPVDRAFTMKGFGTVVTGSVLSGETKVGENLQLLPQKKLVKIRGIQSHGMAVEKVVSGDRAAINLQAQEKSQIHRGDVLAQPEYFKPSRRIDARLQLLESAPRAIKPRTRIRLHFGTTEVMARISLFQVAKIAPGETAYVQFHLENAACARRLDPFVVRQYSPTITVGGGIILDANAGRHKLSDPAILQKMQALENENPEEVLQQKLFSAEFSLLTVEQLASEIATPVESLQQILDEMANTKTLQSIKKAGKPAVVHVSNILNLKEQIQNILVTFHDQNPIRLGLNKIEIQKRIKQKSDKELFDFCLEELKKEKLITESAGLISLKEHKLKLSAEQENLRNKIDHLLFEEGFTTSSENELVEKLSANSAVIQEMLNLMIGLEEIIRIDNTVYFHRKRVQEAREKLVSYLNKNKKISVSEFKDLIGGTSRKYALPLLTYFDGKGITERMEDVRVLRIQ